MIIHFSILGIILVCALIWEQSIKYNKLDCIDAGERYDYKSKLLPWLIVFGYIAFLAAMRSNMNDTSAYIHSFQNLEATWSNFWNHVREAEFGKDWAFDTIGIFIKLVISNDYHIWMAVYAVAESLALIYVFRRYAVSFLDCCFYFLCSTVYYNYFSMMRQWFAVVMLFATANLIKEKKFWGFAVICIAVAQIHASAYLMLVIYFLVQGKAWSKKQLIMIGIFSVVMFFLNPILGSLENSLEGTTYDYAIQAMASNSGSSFVRVFIAAVPVVLAFLYREQIQDSMMNLCVNMSLLNLLLNILATFTSGLYVIRFSTYIGIYNAVLFPYLLNAAITGKNQKVIKIGFYVFYFIFYVYQMKYQGAFGYNSDILGVF
jgi:transmembrane protein EpsG